MGVVSLVLFFNFAYLHLHVSLCGCEHMSEESTEARRGCLNSWSWTYRMLETV